MVHFGRIVALVLGLALAAQSAAAQADRATGDALGALRAIFYHELGHGLIDELDLDVVGAEENVVDEFSTMILILLGQRDNRQIEALMATARFWAGASDPQREMQHYYDEHDLNAKRFFGIICLMHGSDPGRFYPLMTELNIPQNRARRCEQEFADKRENWLNILAPHLRGNAPPERSGTFRPVYGPAGSDRTAGIATLWQQARFIESLAGEAGSLFPLPRDIPVVARDCGMANAFWDGQAITLCYEMHAALAGGAAGGEEGRMPDPSAKAREPEGGPVNVNTLLGSD